jgi:3'(2'), 5'-bisphosphate nucleotidase
LTSLVGDKEPLEEVIRLTRSAGEEVLEVYASGCGVETKQDGSPLTDADRRAQEVICSGLERLAPEIRIVSEEDGRGQAEPPAERFWLVDPLDGTKEFVNRSAEFTINIALIEERVPTLGVVLAPALGVLYAAGEEGAWQFENGARRRLTVRPTPSAGATIVSSRSHGNPEALERFMSGRRIAGSVCAGSSLKFCLVAAGTADVYPRFGRTMEWDTAAGDAILRAAGGAVTDLAGQPLAYGKPGYENPHFIAWGGDPDPRSER